MEKAGMQGKIVLVDGAPGFLKKLAIEQMAGDMSDNAVQIVLLVGILRTIFPNENVDISVLVKEYTTWEARLDWIVELSKEQNIYSEAHVRRMTNACFNRIKALLDSELDTENRLKAPITLIRPTEVSVADIEEDYGLSKYTNSSIQLKFIEGNHITMLDNPKLSQIINELDPLLESDRDFRKYISC
jgi:fatty acid synthase